MNIDACRIKTPDGEPAYSYPKGAGIYSHEYQESSTIAENWNNFSTVEDNVPVEANPLGRWPANSIFSSSCAEVLTKQIGADASTYFFISRDREELDLPYNKKKEDTMNVPKDLVDYLHKMITPTHVGGGEFDYSRWFE